VEPVRHRRLCGFPFGGCQLCHSHPDQNPDADSHTNQDAYPDIHGHSIARFHINPNPDNNSYAVTSIHANADTCPNIHSHNIAHHYSDCNPNPGADRHGNLDAIPFPYGDDDGHDVSDSHADSDGHVDANAFAYPYFHADLDADSYLDADSFTHLYLNTYAPAPGNYLG
jgi:hypothetical protein